MSERITISAPDGRALEVELTGPPAGEVVLFHTGTPSGGTMLSEHVAAGAERGLRHITYARPGYAGSDRLAGRSVADCAGDVVAIADAFGVERFYTVGWSGGGPHALACAALLPGRVVAAASLAGVAPREADGLDWVDGMGEENIAELDAADAGEEALESWMEENAPGLAAVQADALQADLGDLLSPVDRASLTGGFADHLASEFRRALLNGYWGWFDDDLAFARGWGFDLGAIGCPVSIWQGGEDRFVPFGHGEWLARAVPAARSRLRPDQGHLSLTIGAYGELLDDLTG